MALFHRFRYWRIAPTGILPVWLLLSAFVCLSAVPEVAVADTLASGESHSPSQGTRPESPDDNEDSDGNGLHTTVTDAPPDIDTGHQRPLQLIPLAQTADALPHHPALRPHSGVITARPRGPPAVNGA